MSICREIGIEALKTTLPRYISIEDTIYKKAKDENEYKELIYQVIGESIAGNTLKHITSNIKNNKIKWEQACFENIKQSLKEQDGFIEHPFEVEEGVLTCTKQFNDGTICNSKRVYYYQIQTRSSDEPMTTFATCCACGHKWSYSG